MIKVSPAELRDLASRIQGYANEVVSLSGAISNSFASGTENFEGNTKNRFDQRFEEMEPIISRQLPDLLTEFAEELIKAATRFEELDG